MVVSKASAKKQTPIEKIAEDAHQEMRIHDANDPNKVVPQLANRALGKLEEIKGRAVVLNTQANARQQAAVMELRKAEEQVPEQQAWVVKTATSLSISSAKEFNLLLKAPLEKANGWTAYKRAIAETQNVRALDEVIDFARKRANGIREALAKVAPSSPGQLHGSETLPPTEDELRKLQTETILDYGVVTGGRGERPVIHKDRIPIARDALNRTAAKLQQLIADSKARQEGVGKDIEEALKRENQKFDKQYPVKADNNYLRRSHAQSQLSPTPKQPPKIRNSKNAYEILNRIDELEKELKKTQLQAQPQIRNEEELVDKLKKMLEFVGARITGTNSLDGPEHYQQLAADLSKLAVGSVETGIKNSRGNPDQLNVVVPNTSAVIKSTEVMDPFLKD